MGLCVSQLKLRDFRSYEARDISLSNTLTVLVGRNAVGKTNAVEALQMLTAGTSFRHPTPVQQIREGCERARIAAVLEGDGRVVDVACTIEPGRRSFERNGKRVHAQDMPETLMSVLFNPDDLSLVKRGASQRRDELDSFGCQANRGYSKVLAAYQRSIEQRNRLLKDDMPDLAMLDAWDASVALGGATLALARMRLFERLAERMRDIYQQISPGETLSIAYVSSIGEDLLSHTRDEVADIYAARLAEGRSDDLRRQTTLIGPHRDDVTFSIDGRDVRQYGSQGQQRSVVLALKMAEVVLSEEILGEQPLLLLDDVMSELDAERRAAFVAFIQQGIQTVITTTNLGYFPKELLDTAKVVTIDG